jgi:dihydrodipicolinate synthase/N-acetylneuraminate lyase
VKAAMLAMGLIESDAVRRPLLSLEPDARVAMAVTLRSLGLVELRGGRITEAREAVA